MSVPFLLFTVPVFVQAVAAIALAVIAATRHRHAPAKAFAALMLAIAIWSLANVFEKVSHSFELKVAWSNVQYMGATFAPVAWLALGMTFTGRGRWLNRWTIPLLSLVPIFVIVMACTDEFHGLARKSIEVVTIGNSFSILRVEFGPVFQLHIVYGYTLMFIGSLLMFEAMLTGDRVYRMQSGIILLSALIPWLINFLYMIGVPILAKFDPTPVAFSLTIFAAAVCMYQYRLLDLIPVARDVVVEAIVDGVLVLDDHNRILDMNPAAGRILGVAPSALTGRALDDVLPAQAATIQSLWRDPDLRQEIVLGDSPNSRTYELSISPILDDIRRLMGRVVLLRDISDRKKAEASNRTSQARYRSVLEQASDGIFLFDAKKVLQAVNPRGCEMFGYSEQEIIGRNMLDFTEPEDVAKDSFDLNPLLQGKRLLRERRFRHKDGHFIPVEVSATMMADGQFQAIVRDITERKKAEEDRQRLEAQIQHAQKLESLGVLAGGIAHDFNNLLVGMLANAGLALLDLPPDSSSRRSIEQLESAARKASELCKQMLAYSGRGTFDVRAFDLVTLARELIPLVSASVSKKVTFVCDFTDEPCGVEGDIAQVQQLVMNLVTNGAEAIGNGSGLVRVRIGAVTADRSFLLGCFGNNELPEGSYIHLEVVDDGCGMDAETKRKIFDPFFSTKFAGRGLGLAAALGIVRRHRGAILVQSEPGSGTHVSVLLPACELAAIRTLPKTVIPVQRDGSGTILVVDDEDSVRTVAKRILNRFGYDVLLARDGKEAIDTFGKHGDEIRAVLLDLTMPEMNGEETFQEIRHLRPDVKVILSSGYNETEVSDHFNNGSPADFLQKPYGPLDLVDKIREVLEA